VATSRRKDPRARSQSQPTGVRRASNGPRGTRKLPKDIDDLASGRSNVLRTRHKPTDRLTDSRVAGLIPGVANHEARLVYDAHLERLAAAVEQGDEAQEALGQGLCDMVRLGLWRARQLMGFDALAADVLELDVGKARELATAAANAKGWPNERLPDTAVALWLRGEAALIEHCPEGRIEATVEGDRLELRVVLPLLQPVLAADAIGAIGRKAAGLARAIEDEQERSRADREARKREQRKNEEP